MTYLALDLSKRSTGWCVWDPEWEMARLGTWVLGSEFTPDGAVFAKLQKRLMEHHKVFGLEQIWFEQKINAANLVMTDEEGKRKPLTNRKALLFAAGLETHVMSFCYAFNINYQDVHIQSWRGDFIGRDIASDERKRAKERSIALNKRVKATDRLKRLTVERARDLGADPRNDDEADAFGIMDYKLHSRDIQPPWRTETLQPVPKG